MSAPAALVDAPAAAASAASAAPAAGSGAAPRGHRRWVPKRVLVTASAAEQPHTAEVLRRCEAAGVTDVELLRADRLPPVRAESDRAAYALAKATLAVVTSPASARALQPVAPSADWRLDLATGCPAHCQYCYLAGSLTGPPVTRVFADLDAVLSSVPEHVGRGTVTSARAARRDEGTTFEASCYTDPLGIEHLTGSLAATITRFGTTDLGGPVQLRFTTKFDAVEPLLDLPHGGRTRVRASVNATGPEGGERFEGGTARVAQRLAALRRVALAGYPVGLVVAPVIASAGWQERYDALLADAAAALDGVPDLDLTAEVITHRFTPRSKDVLVGWYPATQLEMDPDARAEKRGRFGSRKHVYPAPVMQDVRAWAPAALAEHLPSAKLLYTT